MIKIRIITTGKDKDEWITRGSAHYVKLLSRYADIELRILPSLRLPSSLSPNQVRKKEAALLKKELRGGHCVALSVKGMQYDSIGFAKLLERLQTVSGGAIDILIGGPHGLDDDLVRRADTVLSLAPLTFPHQLVRLILLEQVYRGFCILHGTGYHK